MKWYFGINERATRGLLSEDAKLAVLSAKKNTSLSPNLLYYGQRNEFTVWMESEGVVIHDTCPQLEGLIYRLEREQKYSSAMMGHWLRAEICQLEKDEDFVLYTDCDVIFCREFDATQLRPAIFSCAPEFKPDNWNYFNSGVMILNVSALAKDYGQFMEFCASTLQNARTPTYNDQYCYNNFYRHRWNRLDVEMNWKPYWRFNSDANILHFHGPKISTIKQILNGNWGWANDHEVQIGSLLAGHREDYKAALSQANRALLGTNGETLVGDVLSDMNSKFDQLPFDKVKLNFMHFKMFGD